MSSQNLYIREGAKWGTETWLHTQFVLLFLENKTTLKALHLQNAVLHLQEHWGLWNGVRRRFTHWVAGIYRIFTNHVTKGLRAASTPGALRQLLPLFSWPTPSLVHQASFLWIQDPPPLLLTRPLPDPSICSPFVHLHVPTSPKPSSSTTKTPNEGQTSWLTNPTEHCQQKQARSNFQLLSSIVQCKALSGYRRPLSILYSIKKHLPLF